MSAAIAWPVVSGSLILALLLELLSPGLSAVSVLWPPFVSLVLIYWCLETGDRIEMWHAVALGLLLDLSRGVILGQHALELLTLVFILQKIRLRVRFYPFWQQSFIIFLLLFCTLQLEVLSRYILGYPIDHWRIIINPLVAMALWPWLFLLLDYLHQRFRQRQFK